VTSATEVAVAPEDDAMETAVLLRRRASAGSRELSGEADSAIAESVTLLGVIVTADDAPVAPGAAAEDSFKNGGAPVVPPGDINPAATTPVAVVVVCFAGTRGGRGICCDM
jgi:hypothetical protein